MNWQPKLRSRIRALLRKRELDAEMDEEMRSHIEMRTQANIAAGMKPDEARFAALRQFGWAETIKEECREQRGVRWLEDLIQDVRFGARQLGKNPGFTAVAVLTLALGIGANTAIFSVVNAVLLRPLPYPDADRLMTLWERSPRRGVEQERVSGPDFIEWRAQSRSFQDIGFWNSPSDFNLATSNGVVKVQCAYVFSSLFNVLGVKPLLGRTFLPEEDLREGNRAAVIGYDLWQRRFNGEANVIGRTLTVDSYGRGDYTIVGVMPPGFQFPAPCDLCLAYGWMGVRLDERRSAHWYQVFARLKP